MINKTSNIINSCILFADNQRDGPLAHSIDNLAMHKQWQNLFEQVHLRTFHCSNAILLLIPTGYFTSTCSSDASCSIIIGCWCWCYSSPFFIAFSLCFCSVSPGFSVTFCLFLSLSFCLSVSIRHYTSPSVSIPLYPSLSASLSASLSLSAPIKKDMTETKRVNWNKFQFTAIDFVARRSIIWSKGGKFLWSKRNVENKWPVKFLRANLLINNIGW